MIFTQSVNDFKYHMDLTMFKPWGVYVDECAFDGEKDFADCVYELEERLDEAYGKRAVVANAKFDVLTAYTPMRVRVLGDLYLKDK